MSTSDDQQNDDSDRKVDAILARGPGGAFAIAGIATAIVVALLGQTNPPLVVAAAILFAALQVGASTMESAVGVPSSVVTIIENLVVLFIIGRGALALANHYFNRRRKVE